MTDYELCYHRWLQYLKELKEFEDREQRFLDRVKADVKGWHERKHASRMRVRSQASKLQKLYLKELEDTIPLKVYNEARRAATADHDCKDGA